jgi:GH25 family lysozyme M1 (1,4-beta-N-acetylmuramidase)
MKKTVKKTAMFILLVALISAYLPVISSAVLVEWDGKEPLETGTSYIIDTDIWLFENFVIPEGVSVTIDDGGRLLLSREMTLTVYGTLVIRSGGALEIQIANLDIRGRGMILVSGNVLQYTGTAVNVIEGILNIRDGGEYLGSADLFVFASGELRAAGTLTLTPSAVAIVTGGVEITESGSINNHGSFTITTSGRMVNSGQFSIARDAALTNGGIFTINWGARFFRGGTFVNSIGSVFIDRNRVDEWGWSIPPEKMTAALLEGEERVQILGIDVSHWQFTIDWERVSRTNVEFAMIRAGRGYIDAERPMIEDTRFRENIEGALANGIDVGVYFYSYARSAEEARREAEFLISIIEGTELTYPVVFDIEDPIHLRMSMGLITEMIEAFFEVLIENGYFPMLYSYKNFLEAKVDPRILDTYAVWLAQWAAAPTYTGSFHMWQYTDKGRVSGINGDVDLNLSLINFPEVLRKHRLNRLS